MIFDIVSKEKKGQISFMCAGCGEEACCGGGVCWEGGGQGESWQERQPGQTNKRKQKRKQEN